MNGMQTARDEARDALQTYISRTGLSYGDVAARLGYSPFSIRQFSSGARYGDSDGGRIAAAVMAFIRENPTPAPALPGKLYETECSRAIDGILAYVARGRWGKLYGPAGAQKSFVLKYRAAEAAIDAEPRVIWIECSPALTPTAFLRRVAAALGAPWAQYKEGILQSVLFTLRRRRSPLAMAVDEAQHLYGAVDTLETVRDLGDKSDGKAGVLIAGNSRCLNSFPHVGAYISSSGAPVSSKKPSGSSD